MSDCLYCGHDVNRWNDTLLIHDVCVERLRTELATLRAMVRWKPAKPGPYHFAGGEFHVLHGHGLLIASGVGDVHGERNVATIQLPDEYAMCRMVSEVTT